MKLSEEFIAFRIILFYVLLGGIWIWLSDRFLELIISDPRLLSIWQNSDFLESIISDPHTLTTWQSYKGWAFVLITAGLLYILLRRQFRQLTTEIDERKQAEETARRNEARYALAQQIAGVGTWEWRVETGSIYWSDETKKIYGVANGDFAGTYEEVTAFVHPDDAARWQESVRDSIESGREHNIEFRIVRPDGIVRWVKALGNARYDDSGNVTGMLGVVLDVTAEKQNRIELEQRNQFIETVLDSLPIGLAVNYVDEGTATYMNAEFENIYGWPRESLTDIENFFRCVYPDPEYRRQLQARVLADIESGDPQRMRWEDIEITTQEGQKKIILATNIPLDEQNLMISTVQDITERKQAETALRESEERFRRAIEEAPFPIMIHAEDGQVLAVNRIWTEITGYTSAEIPTIADWIELAYGQRMDQVRSVIERLYKLDHRVEEGEFLIVCKDGAQRIWEFSSTPLGRISRSRRSVISMAVDVTDRKQAEESLRASLHEKELLFRELFHRTKNNMQVISAILMLQVGETDDGRVQEVFQKTSNRIDVMAMVHEKLYQSQNLSNIDLAEYVVDVAYFLMQRHRISTERISLVFDTEPVKVLIDIAVPCGLILNELISNALQHAFPGGRSGTIRIHLRRLRPGELLLEVADDGVGVPPDFDFRQAGNFGMHALAAIVESQLHGILTFETEHGVTCRVQIRDDLYKERV